MGKELIPELHDALKLTKLQHDFSDFDKFSKFSPNTRTWSGIIQHHSKEGFPAWPTDVETFLLHLADGLAANFSRLTQEYKGESSYVICKLWNPNKIFEDKRLDSDEDIIALLKFLNEDPNFDQFIRRYDLILRTRAEDAHPGKNITSLKTHIILTGKFYRVFKKSKLLKVDQSEINPTIEKINQLTNSKMKDWHIFLARCKFHFHQNPARARDMNIFELLKETISLIKSEFSDNLLFASSDEILIFYDDEMVLNQINKIAKDNGLWISEIHAKPRLDSIKPAPEPSVLKEGRGVSNLYPELKPQIKPPICEICQMEEASKIWPDDYYAKFGQQEEMEKEGQEHLCETCLNIRSRPSRLRNLRGWTEAGVNVIWLKISLNYELLTEVLKSLYSDYLTKMDPAAKEIDKEVRFSLFWEFQQDYEEFLSSVRKGLERAFGIESIETLLDDLLCIKADKRSDVVKILELMTERINGSFPEFKRVVQSPVKISISYCGSKFPFFEIWGMINTQSDDLEINLVGHGRIGTSLKYLDQMVIAGKGSYRKSALYNLAEISKLSQKLAELKFDDRTEKGDFETYQALRRNLLPLGMDFKSILTFAKLLG